VCDRSVAGGAIHYDALAFTPTRIKRLKSNPTKAEHWSVAFSPVDERLAFQPFINRLVEVARIRQLI
jgi:hypothetical protein